MNNVQYKNEINLIYNGCAKMIRVRSNKREYYQNMIKMLENRGYRFMSLADIYERFSEKKMYAFEYIDIHINKSFTKDIGFNICERLLLKNAFNYTLIYLIYDRMLDKSFYLILCNEKEYLLIN